jgi:hypothetical protein
MPALAPVASFAVASLGARSGNNYPAAGGSVFHGSNVLPNQLQLAAGHLTFGGSTSIAITVPPRVSWLGLEALHSGTASPRVSAIGLEVLRAIASGPTLPTVSWIGLEALHSGAAASRVSAIGVEVAHDGAADSRYAWIGIEVLRSVEALPSDRGWVCLLAA